MAMLFIISLLLTATRSQSNVTNESHCISELEPLLTSPRILTYPYSIKPNYSIANSVSYHLSTNTVLIAGDLFYTDSKDNSKRNYHTFFQAFTHDSSNKFTLKYDSYAPYNPPTVGNKLFSHKSLRAWTRIIAHPSLPHFYTFGINNLTQYNVNTGAFMWTAKIPLCSSKKTDQPLIYTDATFFHSDTNDIFIAGNCVGPSGKTVIVLDSYSVAKGTFNSTFRQLYNLTDLGFFKEITFLDSFGDIPPFVSIAAPVNETLHTSIVDKYFYVGFTHLLFSGFARIEHDIVSQEWRVKKWREHWTLVNPSFISKRNIVTTMAENGIIALLDPSINGLMKLFLGKMKHLTRWDTKVSDLGQLKEDNKYNKFTWYGGHRKYDLHMDWTLNIDNVNNYESVFVTASPVLELDSRKFKNFSTIAKHDINGEILGGANVPFYALETIVTSDNQIVTVGFEWIGAPKVTDDGISAPNMSDIMPYLRRRAVFSVFSNEVKNEDSCIGCETDFHGKKCERRCACENGYCNDTYPSGDGKCFCTLMSYGDVCRACDGVGGSCDPLKGLCNSGPNGDGKCKFCYDLSVDIGNNISNTSVDFGLGNKFGPECDQNCSCLSKNGICYTTGDTSKSNAGQCLYCKDSHSFGNDCDEVCDCDSKSEYCSNGVSGLGCVEYDYGGLLTDKGWGFYAVIASALFVIFFSITWWQTNKQFKQQNNGQSIPWCPQKEESEAVEDLKENMIKKNLQNDITHEQVGTANESDKISI